MNAIRIVISLFVLVLVATLVIAWSWTAAHQAPAQSTASHVVLALGMIASAIGLTSLWRPRPSA